MDKILKSLPLTFYSVPFYRELVFAWKGLGFGFLAVATLLTVIHFAVILAEPTRLFLAEQKELFDSLPELTIKNGTFDVKGTSPQTITFLKQAKEGPLKIVFDMNANDLSGEALSKKMAAENIVVFVNKNALTVFDKAQNGMDVHEAKTLPEDVITHEQWLGFSDLLKTYLVPIFLVSSSLFSFLGHVFSAFLGAVLLFVIAPLFKVVPTFPGAMRLAAAAKIPVGIVFLIAPAWPIFQLLLWFGFAVFGLLASRRVSITT